ncbi:site-specific integrase [Bradyrhizobium sp. Ec3.3]|uniref:site-specific integrase n=1 Tax=Bradyrhizobium sp. Ec3.3 TaxID=189753 RepID=UPI0004838D9C|nr:site-specific integrase [Bradyrhizobium sp. Ec3.3]
MNKNAFPELMRAFFYEGLVEQRNASIHTVRSYHDAWRLFLRFAAQRAERKVAVITLADLTADGVAAFLGHAEHDRGGTIGTRNCRLAAIRGFFNFVATKDPRIDRSVRGNPSHPSQAGAGIRTLLSGPSGGSSDPCPARPLHARRHARSRTALVPLQQRGTDTGGSRSLSQGDPVR